MSSTAILATRAFSSDTVNSKCLLKTYSDSQHCLILRRPHLRPGTLARREAVSCKSPMPGCTDELSKGKEE